MCIRECSEPAPAGQPEQALPAARKRHSADASGAHVIPSDDDDLDKWTAFFRERAEAKAAKAAREARDARDAHDAHDKAKH